MLARIASEIAKREWPQRWSLSWNFLLNQNANRPEMTDQLMQLGSANPASLTYLLLFIAAQTAGEVVIRVVRNLAEEVPDLAC